MVIKCIVVAAFIGICSITDIWNRKIYLSICGIFLCIGMLLKLFVYTESVGYTVVSVIPGFLMIAAAFVSKERVGYGDGVVIFIVGILCGLNMTLGICGFAFFILSIYSFVMIILKKKKWNDEIPFLPFLMIGNILFMISGGVS